VLAVLPIEQQYFSQRNIPTTYVGHPFFDAVAESELDSQLLNRFDSLSRYGSQLVAVLPGSRDHEVDRNWPTMLESIRRLHRDHPQARFLVAAYRDRQCLRCRDQLTEADKRLPIEFFVGRTSEIIEASRCAMMVSGSVSLEMMARRTPAAVVYHVGRIFHAFTSLFVRLDSMTLPNLISDRKVFPEYVSAGSTAPAIEFLTQSIGAMLGDSFYYRQTMAQLDQLRGQYARAGATEAAARWICESMSDDPEHTSTVILRSAA
jgi:lipid-A-disaccharide synthase